MSFSTIGRRNGALSITNAAAGPERHGLEPWRGSYVAQSITRAATCNLAAECALNAEIVGYTPSRTAQGGAGPTRQIILGAKSSQ